MLAASSATPPACVSALVPFLRQAVEAALAPAVAAPVVHAYLGNEAGDADSLMSAVCHAFVSSQQQGQAGPSNVLILPVLSIPASDLPLRPETQLLLALAGVPEDALLFVDSGGLADLLSVQADPTCELQLTLLDHNLLSARLAGLAPAVVEIVDHHVDHGAYGDQVPAGRRHVAATADGPLVGSACTVVAELLFGDAAAAEPDPAVATLLTGVILIDTVNMDPSVNKGTPRDAEMLERLRPHLPPTVPPRDEFFAQLIAAKFDPEWWARLSAADCLRYDYKQAASAGGSLRYGFASVLLPLDLLSGKPGVVKAAADMMEERELDAMLVMSFAVSGQDKRRELLLVSKRSEACAQLQSILWAGGTFRDELEPLEIGGALGGTVVEGKALAFRQTNLAFSRKQLMPLVLVNTALLGL